MKHDCFRLAAGAGGICDRYQPISGSQKSLNTGIVTNLNYGNTMSGKVVEITLAHEIGHNFGSKVRSHSNNNGFNKFSK